MSQRIGKHRRNGRFSSLNKKAVILLLAVILVLVGLVVLDRRGTINLPLLPDKPAANNNDSGDQINYNPPTEEEKQETEDFKDKQGSQTDTPSPTTTTNGKKAVTPVISSWGYNETSTKAEVSGYVPGILEEGGTCTLTLQKGSEQVKTTKTGSVNVQNTTCGVLSIERDRLSAGTWTATLSYSSHDSEGSSSSVNLEVN